MSVKRLQGGVLIAPVRLGDVRAALVAPDLASADLSNVDPFARQRGVRPAPEIPSPSEERPAGSGFVHERLRLAAFAAISLLIHVGLFAMFWREPEPLASIGEQVISVEIVVGATAPAGVAPAPGESEAQATPAEQPAEVSREAEQKATEQPQDVPVAAQERASEQTAKTDTPVDPKVSEAAKLDETKPRQSQADTEVALLPSPEEKPAEQKAVEQPKSQPKPVKNAAPAKEPRRVAAPTREHAQKQAKATPSAPAANNVGVGRSDTNSNYAGIVSAHLRRHQQYPSDARSRGEQGTATVSFSLDAGGRVTSSRLVRGSGIASIDQEVQAMVRRSSPFPPPPSGHGVSFTVPVSFRLN
jgi:protein TonB